ncbi:MAG TPA: hypothetical protein VMG12_16730 [Polyangiaceae bacterium]|nr:hypothetical protein [Polyangiaceae bacterium]
MIVALGRARGALGGGTAVVDGSLGVARHPLEVRATTGAVGHVLEQAVMADAGVSAGWQHMKQHPGVVLLGRQVVVGRDGEFALEARSSPCRTPAASRSSRCRTNRRARRAARLVLARTRAGEHAIAMVSARLGHHVKFWSSRLRDYSYR